ncbi:MAG: hypothetical protein CMN58_01120 [Solibacterales bacterium]|nr:hypothetical protein [Bryobacterales bacterium]
MMNTVIQDSIFNRFFSRPSRVLWLYLCSALAMTFPLVMHFRSALPAGSGDIWQNYWNFWWWKTSLIELQKSPYQSSYLFHPTGVDLSLHTHSPFNMIVGMPVNLLLGEAAAYNFCILLGLCLAAWGMYFLVKELTGDNRAAFLAGIVFAYFPQHIEQTLEHLNLASVQFLPFTLWFFFRTIRSSSKRNVVGLGGCFALNALCSWHLAVILLMLLAFVGVWELRQEKRVRRKVLLQWVAAGVFAALLVSPAIFPMIEEMADESKYFLKPPVDRGIDASYLMVPPYAHPLWGEWTAATYEDRAYQSAGFMNYLGLVPLVLAVIGLRRYWKKTRLWGFVGLGSLILALGANPWWNGVLYEEISLPFGVLTSLPVLEIFRVANRFLILTSLALAVLVGFGVSKASYGDGKFLCVIGLVFFEYLWVPYPIRQIEISPLYEQLADADGGGAVLDIPFHQRNRTVQNLVAQTVHRRPIGDGYISTTPTVVESAIHAEPSLANLVRVPNLLEDIDTAQLRKLGFEWVVLHKDRRASHRHEFLSLTKPGDILELKRVKRLGGVPDKIFDEIRRQLTMRTGPPVLEDQKVAIFYLGSVIQPVQLPR